MKLLYILFIISFFATAQEKFVLPKDVETKGYILAIEEYIKSKHNLNFDTLFIGKQEDFSDIKLPKIIYHKPVVLLTTQQAEKKFKYRSSFVFINMIGDFVKDYCFFKIIAFKTEKTPEKNYWWPIHNFNIEYNYSLKTKEFQLSKTNFEYPYSNKYAGKK